MRIDCHCDTALFLLKEKSLRELATAHLDYNRLQKYLDISFFALFINQDEHAADSTQFCRHLLSMLKADLAANSDIVRPLLFAPQLAKACQQKQVLLGIEGAACLGKDSEFLAEFFEQGLRFVGITWNQTNRYASGAFSTGEFTEEGYNLIEKCNEMNVLLDGAHLNRASFWQLLEKSSAPVIVSHTCCNALQEHCRNLDDAQMKALAAKGGVMGINFVADFLGGAGDLQRVCEHIEYAVGLIGSSHVAIGSDFDGCEPHPQLAGVEKLPQLYQELSRRGMSDADLMNITGESVLSLLQQVLPEPPKISLS